MAGKTAQQPAVEGPVEETPSEPQQPSSPTTVPEQLVEKIAKPSISVPSTNPAEVPVEFLLQAPPWLAAGQFFPPLLVKLCHTRLAGQGSRWTPT